MDSDKGQRVISFSPKKVVACSLILVIGIFIFLCRSNKISDSSSKFLYEHGDEISETHGTILDIERQVSSSSGRRKFKQKHKTTKIYGQVLIDNTEKKVLLANTDTNYYKVGDSITLYEYDRKYYISKDELVKHSDTSTAAWDIMGYVAVIMCLFSSLYGICECYNGYRLKKMREE